MTPQGAGHVYVLVPEDPDPDVPTSRCSPRSPMAELSVRPLVARTDYTCNPDDFDAIDGLLVEALQQSS